MPEPQDEEKSGHLVGRNDTLSPHLLHSPSRNASRLDIESSDIDSSCGKGGNEREHPPSKSNRNRRGKRIGRGKHRDSQPDEATDTIPSRVYPPIDIQTASFGPPPSPAKPPLTKTAIPPPLSSQSSVTSLQACSSSTSPHSSAGLPPVRLHVASSTPVSLQSPQNSKYLSPTNAPGVFPTSITSVSLLASLRTQMSTISAALSSSLLGPPTPSTPPPPAAAPYSAFAALSQQNSSSSENYLSLAATSPHTTASTSSINGNQTQPSVYNNIETPLPTRTPSPPNLIETSRNCNNNPNDNSWKSSGSVDFNNNGDCNSSSSSYSSSGGNRCCCCSVATSYTYGGSCSSGSGGSGGSCMATSYTYGSSCSSGSGSCGGSSCSSGGSSGGSCSCGGCSSSSSGNTVPPASASVSPRSKSSVFESASNSQLRSNASPNSVSSFASFSSHPPTPTTPVNAVPSSPHAQLRPSPEACCCASTSSSSCTGPEGASSLKFALVDSRATMKKTIIGGGRQQSREPENHPFEVRSSLTPPDHIEGNDHRSHLRTSSGGISPRSLSSMSTFTRAASFLHSPNTNRASPSPTTVNSRSASPESHQPSKRGSENATPGTQAANGHDVAIEPWPLGSTLAFPIPAAATESDPLHGERGMRLLELVRPSRHRSLSKTESKCLASPRTAISSRGRWSVQWSIADPMICQGYLRMYPHGLLSKFRQSKRKYCALDVRLRCFFYWKTLEQRDTGRAKCFSLVVGATVVNDTIEMTYAGGSSTAALKCESPEDTQRWMGVFELLKSGRERSVSRTTSKFVPSSLESAKSTNTYSSPSRDWTPNMEDTFAHTESIRNMFAVEYQRQQHVTKPMKKPVNSSPPPSGHQALTVRGSAR